MSLEQIKRRLLTILAADVAGFSRLVADDEEGTLRRLNTCLVDFAARINAHDGRLVKTAGDGLLASFESPVEALRCAIEMQRAMAMLDNAAPRAGRLRFRIGINLGDVVVQGGDLLGDGVNVAARLEAIADPGGICLSASVFEHVVGKIDARLDDLGEQDLRHIPRPVRAFRVAGLGEPAPPEAPLVADMAEPAEPVLERRGVPAGDLVADGEAAVGVEPGRRRFSILGLSLTLAALVGAIAIYFVLTKTSPPKAPPPAPQAAAPAPAPTPSAQPAPTPTLALPSLFTDPPGKRFAADQVPFVSDAIRERLRAEYVPAPAAKALAISRAGGSAWYVQAQPSEDEAGRRALESCRRSAPEPCDLYALGDRLVWERAPPPMPARPFVPPPAERFTLPFDSTRVPLAGPGMRDRLRSEYEPAAAAKAVAIARTGTVGIATRRASEDEAVRSALEFCGDMAGSACAILAIDDSFVTPIPTTSTVVGVFDPAALPLPPADRDRLAQAYAARGGWKALALGRNGRAGIASRRDSEDSAVADALSECRAAGGQDCIVQAIGIFTVLGR
ncbi:MAG: adenylate/guanylate cyclase domain-containing protein [Alphaproteobacteria bacterium]|nr:adenylate/guanylate cyclase domain-containing protein [Alphaproteobacteria bacterium]